jgi:hypoxanthine phosphoribosyltransferase
VQRHTRGRETDAAAPSSAGVVFVATRGISTKEAFGLKVLFDERQIQEGIRRMADEIRNHYAGRPLTLVGVFIESVILLADLIRLLDVPMRVGLVQAREPRGCSTRPGPLVLNLELLADEVRGRHVLLVDDIFDTGRTLWDLVPQLDELGPESMQAAVLLRKLGRRQIGADPRFVAFDIPDGFVVGYGLGCNDRYRSLPHVALLEPDELAREPEA